MTLSLWTEASRDLDAETAARRMANAKVAVAGLWPFLSLAQSETEFDHRLALASDHIANAVPVDLLIPVEASLREDYRMLHSATGIPGPEQGGPGASLKDIMDMSSGGGSANSLAQDVAQNATGGENPGAPAGGAAPSSGTGGGANVPQGPGTPGGGSPGGAMPPDNTQSVNTPMTAQGSKDAEGEEDADDADGDGKPDWLQDKIKNKKSSAIAFWHNGQQRWVTARTRHEDYFGRENLDPNDFDDYDGPTRQEAEADEHADRQRSEHDDYMADVIRRGPPRGASRVAFFHHGQQRWVTAAVDEVEGGGNPYYFTGGPEAGPNTGQTNQYPPHPTGSDPVAGINSMFPMQPSPWTAGPEWKEVPMNFDPPHPYGNQRQGAAHPVGADMCRGTRSGSGPHSQEWREGGSCTRCGARQGGTDFSDPGQAAGYQRGADSLMDRYNRENPNSRRQGSRHPFVAAGGNREVHHPGDRVRYEGPGPDSRQFEGHVIFGSDHPEFGAHYRVRLDNGREDWGLAEYTHKVGAVESGWSTGDFAVCDSCPNPIKRVKTSWGGAWTHTGAHGLAGDDDHEPYPRSTKVDRGRSRSDSPHHRYTNPVTGRHVVAEEGVEGRPGPNPEFFAGGAEGVAGDQEGGFPADMSQDEQDRVNELYGASPISGGFFDPSMAGSSQTTGARRHGEIEEHHRAPRPTFHSSEEAERYETAHSEGEQQDSRASFTGSNRQHHRVTDHNMKVDDDGRSSESSEDHDHIRPTHPRKRKEHEAPEAENEGHKHKGSIFFDPSDPGVRMVAVGEGSPFSSQTGPDPSDPIDSEFGGDGQTDKGDEAKDNEFVEGSPPAPEAGGPEEQFGGDGGGTPQTTPPRQLPSDGLGGSGENPFEDGPPGEGGDPSITGGEGGQHPGSDLPEGSGSDMVGQGGSTPTDSEDPAADVGNGKQVSAILRYFAEQSGQSYDRPDDDDPTGAGDEFTHNTWDGPMKTRPRQQADDRKINTPQRPGTPIPTVSSPGAPGDKQREGARVALMVTQNLGGGW